MPLLPWFRPAKFFRRLYVFDRLSGGNVEIRIAFRKGQRLAPVLLLLSLAWYLFSPNGPAIVLVTGLGLVLLCAYLWARTMAQKVSGQRTLRYSAVQVGDELEEQVLLNNASHLPALWAEFSDHSELPGYTVTSVRAADGGETTAWRANTICTRRGLFALGPWELHLGEPFGLFEVRQVYLQKNDLLVYPPIAPLPQHLRPPGRAQGELRPLNQPLVAESISAYTARPYQPGDPLRHIHWPISAHKSAPFVRVFEPESSPTVWLIADCDASAHSGEGADSTLETMVLLLASLASHLLNQGLAVGLFALSPPARGGRAAAPGAGSPEGQVIILPRRGTLHLWEILTALACLRSGAGLPFAAALHKARPLLNGRDQILAITPSLDPAWLPALHTLPGAAAGPARRRSAAQVILIHPPGADLALSAVQNQAGPALDTFIQLLAGQGVPANAVTASQLRPAAAVYGDLSRWEFKTLGTGRVHVRHAPRLSQHRP